MSSGILDQPFGQMMSSGSSIAIVGNSMPAAAKLTNTLLAFFRKMRFMAGHTLPAPVAIDKYIRKAILRMEFSVIAPCPAQPADVREIAIHLRKQVRQFEVNGGRLRGARQHCAAVDQ